MNASHQPDPVEAVGHERRDISVRATAIFLAVLQGTMFACCVMGYIFYRVYAHWLKSSAAPISPLAVYTVNPPEPRLQIDSTGDYARYKEIQTELLDSYGWIDPRAGAVRLPIERAKQLLLERGVPARAGGAPAS